MKFDKIYIILKATGLISLIIFLVLALMDLFPVAYIFLGISIIALVASSVLIRYQVKINPTNHEDSQ